MLKINKINFLVVSWETATCERCEENMKASLICDTCYCCTACCAC